MHVLSKSSALNSQTVWPMSVACWHCTGWSPEISLHFGQLERWCVVVVPCLKSCFLNLRCKLVLLMPRLSVDGRNGGHLNFRKSQGVCVYIYVCVYISLVLKSVEVVWDL